MGEIGENESLIYITFDYEGTYIVHHDTRAAYEIGKEDNKTDTWSADQDMTHGRESKYVRE